MTEKFLDQENTTSFSYDDFVSPFESQPFIFQGSSHIIPVLKSGKNNIAGYYSQPDKAGFPRSFTEEEYTNPYPIEYYKSVSDVGN